MNVITITSDMPDTDGAYREFHFRNETRKDSFIRTVYAHRYPIEFSVDERNIKPTRDLLIELEEDPIEYAIKMIPWAKRTWENHTSNHLTDAELQYVRSMA